MINAEPVVEVPAEVLASPSLLFLYYRIEHIFGIKTGSEALIKLNEYLEKRSGASFVENPAAYEYLLSSREHIFEISKFLTVNETYFFREGIHFDLITHFMPQLVKLNRPIQICSAATSIGCEAYSIAMLFDYHAKNTPDFDFAIDAFDINAESIETAKNAHYTAKSLRNDGSGWKHILDQYLIPGSGDYHVSQNIRNKVRFFPHNIMRGLSKKYDIIFFRNALIYFSYKNRLLVLDNLAKSLFNNGFLFLGITETSSVNHPLLVNRFLSDAFYFQKAAQESFSEQLDWKQIAVPPVKMDDTAPVKKPVNSDKPKPVRTKRAELSIDCGEIAAILETEDGKPNAKNILDMLAGGDEASLSGSGLTASVVYLLSIQDLNSADLALSYLEKCDAGAFTRFLRGEYFLLSGSAVEAESCFKEAAAKDKMFWPAFYRIAHLAAEGNRTRYEYKIKKAIESIEIGKGLKYECFMGGFSSDYFRRILEKKLM